MTRIEHLLTLLSEESAEVSQRVSKALRFGLNEIEPGQNLDNAERIVEELADLHAVVRLLEKAGAFKAYGDRFLDLMDAKERKVEKFLGYSKECGRLS